jgi:hypothetical protein
MAIDGTERRRQRPTNAAQQREQYSGKKKTHTAKNLLLVTEHPDKGIDLGPTVAGKKHAKKAAEEEAIAYPTHATLDKDTGFQGYAPAGVLTHQPQKTPGPGGERGGQVPQSSHLQRTRDRRQCDCRGETGSHCPSCLTSDHRGHLGSRDGDCVRLAQSPRELSSPVPRIWWAELVRLWLNPIMSNVIFKGGPQIAAPWLMLPTFQGTYGQFKRLLRKSNGIQGMLAINQP